MSKNTINTRPLRRVPYKPTFYKHKYDATQEYVNLQPEDLIVDKNGIYYPEDGKAFSSVKVDVPTVIYPSFKYKLTPELPYFIRNLDSLKEIIISVNVTKGSSPISLVRIKINGKGVKDFTEDIANGGPVVFTQVFSTPQTENFVITIEVYDTENRMVSMNQDVKFVFRSFYGVINGEMNPCEPNMIKKLIPRVKGGKELLFSGISIDYGRVVYAYPVDQGELISIKDSLYGTDYMDSFSKEVVQIDDCSYYCYYLTSAANIEDIQLTFN